MTRKKKPKNKLKLNLSHIIRKVFSENPESTLNHKQVCALIDVRESAIRKLVFNILERLTEEGFLKKNGHSVYVLKNTNTFYEGVLQITQRGSGFVVLDDTKMDDVFIDKANLHQSLGGDRVKIQLLNTRKSRNEGFIINVIERERTQFVGTIQMHANFAFLIPDNSRIGTHLYIRKEKLKGAKNGDKALAKITVWPKSADNPYGEIIEVLGNSGGNDTEMVSILVNQGLDYKFNNDLLQEAESLSLNLDKKELKKRRDFRNITTFTIDPHDAKDFDDALSFKTLENGNIEIGVHIADVSHYVRPGTVMDKEALKRSNSVYLVDRVIPMLPEQLSNLICSLRPKEEKLTFSAVFEMDENGTVYNEWFGKTVIFSDRRFTYEEAQEIIEGTDGDYKTEILFLDKIAKTLRKNRLNNGAMNIESSEMRFQLNEKGHPIQALLKTSKDANKLVEEFMLLANKKVASFIYNKKKDKIPFIYRCHDKPDIAKVELFKLFVKKFGYDINIDNTNHISKNINSLLNDVKYKNEFELIQTMAIRSMSKATYETLNIGHYGLAFNNYTHFTSPIRRYADLMVHRILQEELIQTKQVNGNSLDDICKRISRMERKAVSAERESIKYFQTLFVANKVGDEFEGTVSGIAEFGVFVKMDNNLCEGLVPMKEIPGDYYSFDSEQFTVIGSRTGKEYNFGDRVKVRIQNVSTSKRQIDLEMIK
ncbi:MAG: ribonuclease R [Crocinitomicaceae bacterium]|nr:ribonuclease R [Crocinitomicaceae bacterium]MDG1775756.1 ribonuclease R [Crocinitomicaceae bacterium]